MARKRVVALAITVTVPATAGEFEVEQAIHAALEENPTTGLDWGNWEVGAAIVTGVDKIESD